jgi:predicted enzyme related to lactoylglutathione lyase
LILREVRARNYYSATTGVAMFIRTLSIFSSLVLSAWLSVAAAATPGQPVWLDLLTDKPAEAMSFYQQVFGWQHSDSGEPGYSLITSNDRAMGAVMETGEGFRVGDSLWLMSVAVDDVDAALKSVQQQGGNLIDGPATNLEGQRYAIVTDAQGAAFILLSGSTASLDNDQRDVNGWVWAELWTPDAASAVNFYKGLADYEVTLLETGADKNYSVLSLGNNAQLGIVTSPWSDMPANWLPYILVKDVNVTLQTVMDAGGLIVIPPKADADGTVAILMDPTGGVFAIQQEAAQ